MISDDNAKLSTIVLSFDHQIPDTILISLSVTAQGSHLQFFKQECGNKYACTECYAWVDDLLEGHVVGSWPMKRKKQYIEK